MSKKIVILFDSVGGLTEQLAKEVLKGAQSVPGTEIEFCRIHETSQEILLTADALILGSPNYSGATGKLKGWFDGAGGIWETSALKGKIGAVFSAGWSHAGLEATLLQLLHLLFAYGFWIGGIPWAVSEKNTNSYYGAAAVGKISKNDKAQAQYLGRRVALFAVEQDR